MCADATRIVLFRGNVTACSGYGAGMSTLLLFLFGCGGQSGENGEGECEPALTPTSNTDTSLGFSAEDVADLLDDHLPVSVTWDEMTQGETTTDITLQLALEGEPSIASPGGETPNCPEEDQWLRVPVTMEVSLASGQVVASGVTELDVGALDLARVHLTPGWDLPAELFGDYADQFEAYFETEYGSREFTLDSTWVVLDDTWAEPTVDIAFQFTSADAGGNAGAWRGTWVLP